MTDEMEPTAELSTPVAGGVWLTEHRFAAFPTDHPELTQCSGIGKGHDPAGCGQRGKHPSVPFTREHTMDPGKIRRLLAERPQNVAVYVGACTGPDGEQLLVVDSDRPGAIEDVAKAHGEVWPATMRVRTAKGYHDYLWAPAGLKLGNGLGALKGQFDGDVRAGNAYVVGPGSLHQSGVIYTLEDPEQPPEQAPAWLLDALTSRPVAPAPPVARVTIPMDRLDSYTRKVVQDECDAITRAPDGDQNNTINTAAFNVGTLVGAGALSESEAREHLLAAARLGNHPEGRALPTIESGLRAGQAQPRLWPPAGRDVRQIPVPGPSSAGTSVISVRQSVGVEDDWEEPLSIDRPTLAPFPVDLLGPNLAAIVKAVTAQVQVAPDIPAMIALPAISVAIGGRAQVRIRPGWSEAIALWTATVAGAGERKSAAEAPFSDTLRGLERELQAKAIPEIEDAEQLMKIAQARLEDAEKAAIKAKPDLRALRMDEAKLAKQELREMGPVPALPRLLFGDITPAAMPVKAAQQGGRMGVIHSEGTLIKQMGGLYNSGASDTGFALDAYDGKAMPVDRVGRDSIEMESAHLTIGLLVQPIILEQLGRKKDDEMLHNGFVQRFLYGFPASRLGYQDPRGSVPIPAEVMDDLRYRLGRLVHGLWKNSMVRAVTFTDEASEVMYVFQEEMQERLRRGGDLHPMASWASKLPGKLARIAALITLYENPDATQVQASELRAALAMAPYFITHARLCLDLMGANRDAKLMPARDVLEWLRRRKEDKRREPFTVRDAQRGVDGNSWGPEGVTSETVHDAIHVLVDKGWVVPLPAPERPEGQRGRAPSPRFAPHPLVWDSSWKKKEVSETRLRSA
ncbi:DUF3987 domain-containing protein [Streptomyces canus]|uniref:DUF3987 domain-containing protein n=1 Tax=Streptomyces canus TaxID=58343 RepID=UPI00131CF497|nr:DUF3987 domain-containing protein [Streptomyces canus]